MRASGGEAARARTKGGETVGSEKTVSGEMTGGENTGDENTGGEVTEGGDGAKSGGREGVSACATTCETDMSGETSGTDMAGERRLYIQTCYAIYMRVLVCCRGDKAR